MNERFFRALCCLILSCAIFIGSIAVAAPVVAGVDLTTLTEDELHSMQSAIFDELSSRRTIDRYENGELAYVQTEWGNYFFGVTNARILPANGCRDAVYQLTWESRNEDFVTGDGIYLSIFETGLSVVDSNGYRVSPMQSGWDGDWINSYPSVAPGTKCITSHTFTINDPACEYLDVCLDPRNINCRIYIDGVARAPEKPTPEAPPLDCGMPVTVSAANGTFKFQVDGAHFVDWPNETSDRPGTSIAVLQGVLENVSYKGMYSNAISAFEINEFGLVVADKDGYALEFYDTFGHTDGQYEVDAIVKIGTKKRVALPYFVSSDCDSLTITVGTDRTMTIPLEKEEPKSTGQPEIQNATPSPTTNVTGADIGNTQSSNGYTQEDIDETIDLINAFIKAEEFDTAWELIELYAPSLDKSQLKNVLLTYGRWKSLGEAEAELKTYLKSPRSYYRYSGSITKPELRKDGSYMVTLELTFGATNSFGGEVTDTVTMYVYFTIDTDDVTVTHTGAELSAYDILRFMD